MILQSGTIISHPTLGENRESDADFQWCSFIHVRVNLKKVAPKIVTHFKLYAPILYSSENGRKPLVSWCFQVVSKWNIGLKWVKIIRNKGN